MKDALPLTGSDLSSLPGSPLASLSTAVSLTCGNILHTTLLKRSGVACSGEEWMRVVMRAESGWSGRFGLSPRRHGLAPRIMRSCVWGAKWKLTSMHQRIQRQPDMRHFIRLGRGEEEADGVGRCF
jgi:hypothetical protein